jgi:hypothetical protein
LATQVATVPHERHAGVRFTLTIGHFTGRTQRGGRLA